MRTLESKHLNFEFATATRILFGCGVLKDVGRLAAQMGRCAMVATGQSLERSQPLLQRLSQAGLETVIHTVSGEPTLERIENGVEAAHAEACDLVIGYGGGSAIDSGKAIAALAANPGETLDYLEVIGRGIQLERPPVPFIAIPTTAGTGSEVTRNAVIGSPQHGVKVSLRSLSMLPNLAIVDPEQTYSLPPDITASTGMDALTQLIEPYTGNRPNALVDPLCEAGIGAAGWALRRAYVDGEDAAARQAMSLAALYGGLALANAKLGAVHGFAAVLGGMFPAPHGAVCARLLPFVFEINIQALNRRAPDSPAIERYRRVACALTSKEATAADGVTWLYGLIRDLDIPTLRTYGVKPQDFPDIIDKAARASSMQGNPIKLTESELYSILENAL